MSEMLISSFRLIDPFKIEEYDLTIEELLHPICMMPRYGGHTKAPYTVGEHTFHLINHVPRHLRKTAALHDLSEGIVVDLPRPIKREIPQYMEIEDRIQRHIFDLFDEPFENMEEFNQYDYRICQDEMEQLFVLPYDCGLQPLGVTVKCWPWDVVKVRLRGAFHEIGLIECY